LTPHTIRAFGAGAARRAYVTFVQDSDRVGRRFVEALAEIVSPNVVAVARVVAGAQEGTSEDAEDFPGDDAGRALPTDIALAVALEGATKGDCAEVFWATALVRGRLRPVNTPPAEEAAYRRAAAQEPQTTACTTEDLEQQITIIGALSDLLESAGEAYSGLLRGRIAERTRLVNAYLRANHGGHDRVVELLDRHQVAHIPYEELNRDLARGLVIAYAFPPYTDTSAIVMAKRVRSVGAVVDVIANAMDRIRDVDDSLLRISGPYVATHKKIATPTYFSNWRSMEQFAIQGLRAIGDRTVEIGGYEWIYSRAQFAASHFLAAAYKLDHPELPWLAEFSDPLSRDVTHAERGTPVTDGPLLNRLRDGLRRMGLPAPESTNCFVWCEELAYALADELIFTNRNQLEYMLGYCSRPELVEIARAKAVVRPHPTLPAEFYSMADPDYHLEPGRVHVAYFGNFYATRGLDDVLRALTAIPEPTRARLRLHILTSRPDDLRRRVAELDLTPTVRVGPYVRYLEFLALTKRFDCLLVNDAATRDSHGSNPYLPSKWSDYRGSGTPVWGLCEAGSTLSEQELAYVSPTGDVDAAAEVLARIAMQEPVNR
jgi:glycosyltransferase involved in cell wall biosynthesis